MILCHASECKIMFHEMPQGQNLLSQGQKPNIIVVIAKRKIERKCKQKCKVKTLNTIVLDMVVLVNINILKKFYITALELSTLLVLFDIYYKAKLCSQICTGPRIAYILI